MKKLALLLLLPLSVWLTPFYAQEGLENDSVLFSIPEVQFFLQQDQNAVLYKELYSESLVRDSLYEEYKIVQDITLDNCTQYNDKVEDSFSKQRVLLEETIKNNEKLKTKVKFRNKTILGGLALIILLVII